ncbi:YdbL family protein [Sphingomonas edaphi]|uniref:DUF1318 domain-containing protein n=1 Tax=Sphingomonas edaphi TaxID=2315689 RepID=A0A418Q011_9SPHN|nr:YdbL family protein [Sphingomonas edaphi]RIX29421.1 DUF1318 domain-containing protein [Sphingomonas edaphi]
MTRIALPLIFVASALALKPALAQRSPVVAQARAAGQVGERYDGYLGVVGAVPDEVRRQVGAVNIKRRSLYASLAARKRVTTEEVGITAACSLLRRVAVGEVYFAAEGGWKRRIAEQPAPVPAYCG